jgi:LysR family transcriptional regulator, benzoate and cis,cis-muconate-responsive activator of ben and cat genes
VDLRQLRFFAAVATELSFTKAARKLHISQPPLSHQINVLEAELGTRLLIRTSRSVQLSEAGKALLPHALAIFERLDEARLHVQRVVEGLEGRIKIGLTGSHFLCPLPKFIKEFRQSRPGVEIVLQEMPPIDQISALRESRLDLCFERGAPVDTDLAADLLWQDQTIVVLPLGHRLAARNRLRLRDLRSEDFVFLRLGSSLFARSLYAACISAKFEPRIVQQVVEVPAVLNLVAAGLGVSVIPKSIVRLRPDAVVVCKLIQESDANPISADIYLVRRADELRPVILEFVRALLQWSLDP